MVIKAFETRKVTVSGDLKSEKIGDYEYIVMSAAESEGLSSVAMDFDATLASYRTLDI